MTEEKAIEICKENNIDITKVDFEEYLKIFSFLTSLGVSNKTDTLQKLYDPATKESEYDSLIDKLAEEIKTNEEIVNRDKIAEKIISKKDSLKAGFKVLALFETAKEKAKEMTSPSSLDKSFAEAIPLLQSKDWKERIQGEMIETDARIVTLQNYLKNYEQGDVEYRMNIKRLVHLQDYYQDLAELVRFEEIELPKALINIPDGYMYGFKKEAE